MTSYQKVKDVAKRIEPRGPRLRKQTLDVMKLCSDVVGGTLGPSGRPVIIERQEHGLPAIVTKDGVTVFRALGMKDPVAHCIMEAARQASIRTATEAGDGTTTATILAESIVRRVDAYAEKHSDVSPQKIVSHLEYAFSKLIKPTIESLSTKTDLATEEGKQLLFNVARVSANGDGDLAKAVMECYNIAGDDGNVTLTEISGPSHYEVEHLEGYPVPIGYEESGHSYQTKFINDPANSRVYMEKPVFVLYHGRITEIQTLLHVLNLVGRAWGEGVEVVSEDGTVSEKRPFNHNLIIVATGFSDTVLGSLGTCFAEPHAINPFPLVVPHSPVPNGQLHFLQDLAAITGATVFDPLNLPLDRATLADLGPGITSFEATRFRSTLLGKATGVDRRPLANPESSPRLYEDLLVERCAEIQSLLKNPASEYDAILLHEQLAKLTGGIAKLKICGSSNGETKEKRDRAEDAVCAVRGAIRSGCLPGGGWTLLRLIAVLTKYNDPIFDEVLCPALSEPFEKLLTNCGYNQEQIVTIRAPIDSAMENDGVLCFDASEHKHVDPYEVGLLDSTPAVLQAIQNALSIASLLGVLGAAVVFERDAELERREAQDNENWLHDAGVMKDDNPANERP